ncbi:MAG: NUDIX domain-containing protein [Chloroflexi bacterium]|nr:NUDIX domain-containing protein [Chloroflexota bacterium]
MTRDFTVATFVVHQRRVLLLRHPTLALWLPPGGHIDPPELPDEAAVREVAEEAGLHIVLAGQPALALTDPAAPRQLIRPEGIQLELIRPGHEHIDLVYFARLAPDASPEPTFEPRVTAGGWYALADLPALGVTPEIAAWCAKAVAALS